VPAGITPDRMKDLVAAQPKVQQLIEGRHALKVVAVPGKLVNIVVK
jgi:leucyl-tRNA synthetase